MQNVSDPRELVQFYHYRDRIINDPRRCDNNLNAIPNLNCHPFNNPLYFDASISKLYKMDKCHSPSYYFEIYGKWPHDKDASVNVNLVIANNNNNNNNGNNNNNSNAVTHNTGNSNATNSYTAVASNNGNSFMRNEMNTLRSNSMTIIQNRSAHAYNNSNDTLERDRDRDRKPMQPIAILKPFMTVDNTAAKIGVDVPFFLSSCFFPFPM
ncbi:hypothetical protein RFI_15753 [Reticulomyxa filosa]|uniref:Uncharacterized protein n=1 Tax=Reticulomyxa filosa TaxID=46433 RepID=X6N619_RETFI|nr:hypothetical protein RFI_15753 [Reticulomyxa filosa]|eukprot:ETO21451.1 hypothetical protein RFI_15753 [Reticulomyxa filosa]